MDRSVATTAVAGGAALLVLVWGAWRAAVSASAASHDKDEDDAKKPSKGGRTSSAADEPRDTSSLTLRELASLRATNERYRNLIQVTKAISAESHLKDAIDRIIAVATQLVHADRVTLFVVNEAERYLSVGVSKGTPRMSHKKLGSVRIPLDKSSVAGYAAVSKSTLVIHDAYRDSRFDPSVDADTRYKTNTILCVPLFDQAGNTLAVVQAINKLAPDAVATSGDGVSTVASSEASATGSGAGAGAGSGSGALSVDASYDKASTASSAAWPVFTEEDRFLLESIADFAGGVLHKLQMHEETVSARLRTEHLIYLMRTVSAESETSKMIEQIIKVSYHLLDAERVTLFMVDSRTKELVISESPDAEGVRIPLGRGLAGFVAQTAQALNIKNAYEDPRFDRSVDAATKFRTRSVLCVPVPDKDGKPVAVLQAINKGGAEGSFDDTDCRILEYMAGHAGIMLRKAQLMEQMRRARRATEALLGVVRLVAAEEDIHALVAGIVAATYGLLKAERVSMFLVDPIKNELWMAVSEDAKGVRIPIGHGLAGWVADKGEALNIPDAYDDERFNRSVDAKTGFRTRSVLCVPVCMGGDAPPLAVVMAINKTEGSGVFGSHDQEALTAFCAEVALALKRKSVEAAFTKVLSDGHTKTERAVDVSFLALYSDQETTARLHTQVTFRDLSVEAANKWPRMSGTELMDKPDLHTWSLDCFTFSQDRMLLYLESMFASFKLTTRFAVPAGRLRNFILAVRGKYRDNPFHNFFHAFSVCHAAFLVMQKSPAGAALTYVEIFATLVAALCHDIDHPGHNNAFEINTLSQLALRHNDDAVLERHHAHTCFQTLWREKGGANDVFDTPKLAKADRIHIRRVIIEAILATDMARHFRMCAELSERIAAHAEPAAGTVRARLRGRSRSVSQRMPRTSPGFKRQSSAAVERRPATFAFDSTNDEDRLELVRTVVHCSDLSGQAYHATVARKWGDRIIQEFRVQAEHETAEGIPVAPFMANLDTPVQINKLQLSFIDNVVLPLWESVGELMPGLKDALDNLYSNRLNYHSKLEAAQKAEEEEAAAAARGEGATGAGAGAGAGSSATAGPSDEGRGESKGDEA